MPYRGTWTEKGEVIEACFSFVPYRDETAILMYFNDRTVGVIPPEKFARIQRM